MWLQSFMLPAFHKNTIVHQSNRDTDNSLYFSNTPNVELEFLKFCYKDPYFTYATVIFLISLNSDKNNFLKN